MSCVFRTFLAAVLLGSWGSAHAGPDYLLGYVVQIGFKDDTTLVRFFNGVAPDNCASSPYGWMQIPAQNKSMQAFVLGLWLNGTAPQTSVMVYTNAPASAGAYCTIKQLNQQN